MLEIRYKSDGRMDGDLPSWGDVMKRYNNRKPCDDVEGVSPTGPQRTGSTIDRVVSVKQLVCLILY